MEQKETKKLGEAMKKLLQKTRQYLIKHWGVTFALGFALAIGGTICLSISVEGWHTLRQMEQLEQLTVVAIVATFVITLFAACFYYYAIVMIATSSRTCAKRVADRAKQATMIEVIRESREAATNQEKLEKVAIIARIVVKINKREGFENKQEEIQAKLWEMPKEDLEKTELAMDLEEERSREAIMQILRPYLTEEGEQEMVAKLEGLTLADLENLEETIPQLS